MTESTQLQRIDRDRRAARRNYTLFCSIAAAVLAGVVGGIIALFLQ